jgi:hypothetical protein
VREIVIVIVDLFLPRAGETAAWVGPSPLRALPGFEQVARFGTRQALAQGWRAWLAQRLGHAELNELSLAAVAAAVRGDVLLPAAGGSFWLATPLQLTAGLTRVHLEHGAILALLPAEQAVLAADFKRILGGAGAELIPLPNGEFLLRAPDVPALPTVEPARCAGQEVAGALPASAAAAPLRRLLAEIEMWLHAHALNEARRQRGAAGPTALWLWGAEGRMMRAEPKPGRVADALAYGRDAWLQGCLTLAGSACRPLSERWTADTVPADVTLAVWALEVGGELQRSGQGTAAEALQRLDERFVSPALAALRSGAAERLTLILNDAALTVTRRSHWRLWRRSRAGLEGFA